MITAEVYFDKLGSKSRLWDSLDTNALLACRHSVITSKAGQNQLFHFNECTNESSVLILAQIRSTTTDTREGGG